MTLLKISFVLRLRSLALALLGGCLAAGALAQPRFDFDRTPGHLPKAARPTHQALLLEVDPDRDTFEGETTITLQLRAALPALVLHAHQLTLKSSAVIDARGERALTMQADDKAQTWRLSAADGRPLARGTVRLRLSWTGRVQGNGSGLFLAPYQAQGVQQRMLATQLEAVYARRVFPAFDEPAFRTRFELTVRAPKGWQVLSNTPAAVPVDEGGHALHRFAQTPPMPSYLMALAVGRFDALEGHAAGVPLRVLTSPGKQALGAYALASTQKILPYFTAYFGQPYSLAKLDQLAVPSTRNGAMEDWGLISYAEGTLLFDPATGNTNNQRRIFSIVAHEVAHQWFGNLVTAASWEEIWLNEAFATWMADKASERFNPEWQQGLRRRGWIDRTMERDGGPATRAIRSGAVPEDRVFDVFDNITYTKGGAVLGMLEQWIGDEPFRRGLAGYMKAQRMSNATAGDLWFHIGRASGRNVAAVAASWTDQPGFPLISADSRCEGGRTRIDLAQQPFSSGGLARTGLWQVPLVLSHGGTTHRVLMQQPRQAITLPGCPAAPLVINPQGIGFYRVAYAPALQAALAQGFAQLPASAQITLLSDTFALAQAGRLPMSDWLALVAAVPQTGGAGRPALLGQAQASLRLLGEALAGSPGEAPLQAAARALLAPELKALGWSARPGEDSEAEALRASLITDLARHGDAGVTDQALALFDADEAGRTPLPGAIRAAVVRAVGRAARGSRFEALQRRLLAASSDEDRWLFAEAMALVADESLVPQVLALSLDSRLPVNVATRLPGLVADGLLHGELAYRHVQQHWPELARRAGDMEARAWLLPGAATHFNSVPLAQRLLEDQRRLLGDPGAATAQRVAARIGLLARIQSREIQRLPEALAALAAQLSASTR